MLKRILAATDGSPRAQRAVDFAASLARCFGAPLSLVHVQVTGATPPGDTVREQAGRAGATLIALTDDSPAEAICRLVEEEGFDAIVLGNAGMSERKQFLLGNVPNRVSHHAHCTVIIVDTRDVRGKRR